MFKRYILLIVLVFFLVIFAKAYAFGDSEKPSPFDRIPEENIRVYSDRVVIYINNPEWAAFDDTNSMDPVLDTGANAIQIVPKNETEIHAGDIISYKSEYVEENIIHRVKSIGSDDDGWYCIAQGDNNPTEDPERIRFSQIKKVLVAIIY